MIDVRAGKGQVSDIGKSVVNKAITALCILILFFVVAIFFVVTIHVVFINVTRKVESAVSIARCSAIDEPGSPREYDVVSWIDGYCTALSLGLDLYGVLLRS